MGENLDFSVVLSTMSPKTDRTSNKKGSKKISKLALKRQLRRSSIYDKLPYTAHSNVISISDTTETCSSSSRNSVEGLKNQGTHTDNIIMGLEMKQDNYNKLTTLDAIENWVREVNAYETKCEKPEEIESCNMSVFSEISAITSDDRKTARVTDISGMHLVANSTYINDKQCFRIDEMFQQKSLEHMNGRNKSRDRREEQDKDSNLTSKQVKDELFPEIDKKDESLILSDSYKEEHTPVKTKQEVKEHEKLLDELYGNSWRANKERVLTYSEPKKKVKTNSNILFPNTERKLKQSITHKNPYLISEIDKSKSLIRTLHLTRAQKMIESPLATRFKDICDSESNDSMENLYNSSPVRCRTKLFLSDSDTDSDSKDLEMDREINVNKITRNVKGGNKEIMNDINIPVFEFELNDADLVNKDNGKEFDNINGAGDDSFCSIKFDKIQTLEDQLEKINKTGKQKEIQMENKESDLKNYKKNKKMDNGRNNVNKDFDDAIQLLEDELRKDMIFNKKSRSKVQNKCEDKSNSKTNCDLVFPDDKKDKKNKKFTNPNIESTKNKTDLNISPSPESKLRHILRDLSIDKKPDITPSTSDIRKSKRANSKKNVKYFHTSSDDSHDSSDEYLYSSKSHQNSRNFKKAESPSFLASLSSNIPIEKCDASARIYRNMYKTCKGELATKLFNLYNEKIFNNSIPNDTLLEWNERMRGTAGFCYCRKITRRTGIIERTVRITLATKILDSADRLRDTLVHEMCHAATWVVNEVSDGHGQFWKAWAKKAMKTFPELPPIKRCHDYVINTKYTYKCSSCGYCIGRHSKSLDIERKRCGYCYGKFDVFINKTTKNGFKAVTPATPKKEPTGFALFVKENYGSVKNENRNHAEVMKVLSKKYSEVKSK